MGYVWCRHEHLIFLFCVLDTWTWCLNLSAMFIPMVSTVGGALWGCHLANDATWKLNFEVATLWFFYLVYGSHDCHQTMWHVHSQVTAQSCLVDGWDGRVPRLHAYHDLGFLLYFYISLGRHLWLSICELNQHFNKLRPHFLLPMMLRVVIPLHDEAPDWWGKVDHRFGCIQTEDLLCRTHVMFLVSFFTEAIGTLLLLWCVWWYKLCHVNYNTNTRWPWAVEALELFFFCQFPGCYFLSIVCFVVSRRLCFLCSKLKVNWRGKFIWGQSIQQ